MRRSAWVFAALAALAVAPTAQPSGVTSAQLASLAARAPHDLRALAELRAVDRVDGRPVDLRAALDANGPELNARLRVLATQGAGRASITTADPRATAHAILAGRRFSGSNVPRPLHGPLHWLGERVRHTFEWVTVRLPGGGRTLWSILAGLVVAVAALTAARLVRRRGGRMLESAERRARAPTEDPRRLEREADDAERNGDLARALRLRFQAGLVRLARSEAIPARTSLTNGEIARRLQSPVFAELADDFDEIVYGGRSADAGDVARARAAWPRVLEGTRR
jgi:hypothetical protein